MPPKLKLKWRPILKKCRLADIPLELILELAHEIFLEQAVGDLAALAQKI